MLDDRERLEVKERYIKLLRQIKRRDFDVDGLIQYLECTDFFDAPASTQYHCSFPSGLCLHSLNVFDCMCNLLEHSGCVNDVSQDSVAIVALFHDFGKINFYEPSVKNEKVYSKNGTKRDELGTFDWVSTRCYKVKEPKDREIVGSRGFKAYSIASMFIPLTNEEMITLVNQYSATDKAPIDDLSNILAKYNLAVYLHSADIITTYCWEKSDND